MTSSMLFQKLLNLAIELDEKGIRNVPELRDILHREALPFKEGDTELELAFDDQLVCFRKTDIHTQSLWEVLDEAVERYVG